MVALGSRVRSWIAALGLIFFAGCAASSTGSSGPGNPLPVNGPAAAIGGGSGVTGGFNGPASGGAAVGAPGTNGTGTAGTTGTPTLGAAGMRGTVGGSGVTGAVAAAGRPPVGPGPVAMGAAGTPGGSAGKAPIPMVAPNQLPPVTDYTQPGPFNPTTEMDNTGPDGMYTMYLPTSLEVTGGFKFVPLTWGNGITTTPQTYPILLNTVASHGFIVIASNDSAVTPDEMIKGLDWLLMQGDSGMFQGKLDTSRGVCMGYSLGGGGSVTCGAMHPKVIATIAMHPAGGFPVGMRGPLLLFSGTDDTVCVPAQFVQPVFDQSQVPTFFGMLQGATHFEPVLSGGQELGPSIAWLRLQVFGDQNAKPFFYGTDCTLCKAPWTMPQSKMLN